MHKKGLSNNIQLKFGKISADVANFASKIKKILFILYT